MAPETDKDAKQLTPAAIWGVAALVGVLACIILYVVADVGIIGAIFLGAILAVIVGFALQWRMKGPPALGSSEGKPAAPKPASPEPSPPTPKVSDMPQPPMTADTAEAVVKPTTPLPGQAELAARKGDWRYQAEDSGSSGSAEGAIEGVRPETLSAPRDGKADDLKEIKGIGPKLERMLNDIGFFHFDQIAALSDQEIAWVDSNIEGFKGRISRDDWVGQARDLARGS